MKRIWSRCGHVRWFAALAAAALYAAAPSAVEAQQPTVTAGASATATPGSMPSATSPNGEPTTTPTTAAAATTATGPTAAAIPDPSAGRPILVLQGSSVEPSSAAPGEEVRLRLDVRNVGSVDAERVHLTVSSLVLRAVGRGASLYKEEIDAGETRPFELRLRVDDLAAAGVHELAIALRWEDAAGNAYDDETSLGIRVHVHLGTRPQLVVEQARLPGQVAPGAAFQVDLAVRNGGGSDARNVVATTAQGPLAPRQASPPTSIGVGASATLTLVLVASAAAEPGAVSQTLELRYSDADGEQYADTFPIGLVISGEAALGPMPVVTHYDFGGELAPGQVFELVLEVENVGPSDAQRTRLVLGGGAMSGASDPTGGSGLGVVAPLETSNVRYLGRLAAGAIQTVRQKMVVSGAAKAGVYVLDVTFQYADPEGRAQVASSVVSLLVGREVQLLVNPIDVVTSTVVGDRQALAFEIVNAGTDTVNIGNVKVTGGRALAVEDGTVFVGPLDGAGFYPVDVTVIGKAPGRSEITVTVEYVDDFRRAQKVEERFDLEVVAAPERPNESESEQQGPGRPLWLRIVKGFLGLGASGGSVPVAGRDGSDSMGLPSGRVPSAAPASTVPDAEVKPVERAP